MSVARTARQGFTLIELLTVIAIIAILAAIIFPVFNRVRENARQTSCMSQMHAIYQAVAQYRLDNNKYPPVLLGYVQDSGGAFYTGSGQPVSIDQLTYRPLTNYQKYIKDKEGFLCPDSQANNPVVITTAVYPANVGPQLAGQPVVFNDLLAHSTQNSSLNQSGNMTVPVGQNAYFYAYDSYDTGPQVTASGTAVTSNGKPVTELHYSLDWTGVNSQQDMQQYPNQLKYPNPPADSTVLTWCTYHVATAHNDMVTVLTLAGKTVPVPVSRFENQGPLGYKP